MEKIQKNDIVRTPRGYLASVVSVGEFVNCSYIKSSTSIPMSFKSSELFLVKSGVNEFWGQLFKKINKEELREEIKQERALRATLPTKEEKVIRKRDNFSSLLKDLTQEDQEALIKMLRERRRV